MTRGWGRTLVSAKGSTRRNSRPFGRTFGSLYAACLAIAAAAISVMAVVLALSGSLAPGVVADDPGGLVQVVDPGGFAWRAGIRPGQRVVTGSAVDDPDGWSIETSEGSERYRATAESATGNLRQSTPVAVVAAFIGLLGLAALPTRRRRAELLAAVALACASLPLWLSEDPLFATAAAALAPPALVLWLIRWREVGRLSAAILATSISLQSFLYVLAHAQGSPLAADLDGVAFTATIALLATVLMGSVQLAMDRAEKSARTVRLLDAAAVVVIVFAAGIMSTSVGLPLPLIAAVIALLVMVYVVFRTGIGRLLDRVLLAEVRERAALQAAEGERARLSRELHDDPLQALAGVIHRLERSPDTEAEQAALRAVAVHLRDVATELHPPVLDDLGLVPAIESLRPADSGIQIDIMVTDSGYRRSNRPPAEVEIATYRIVQEALANAIAHSGGKRIEIVGEVGHSRVALEITDDGCGLSGREIEAAMRAGHIGVASMRRRAGAIDAQLAHRSIAGSGTTVSLNWRA